MKAADIALTIIPQDRQQKKRPVLILKIFPKYNDLLVCAISSQLHQEVPGFDLLLEDSHPAFIDSGLKTSSIFRLGTLAVMPRGQIIGTIGSLKQDLYEKIIQNLTNFLLSK